MSNSITNWSNCRYSGIPGSNGHRVHADKMTKWHIDGKTLTMCEDCKARKILARKAEKVAR